MNKIAAARNEEFNRGRQVAEFLAHGLCGEVWDAAIEFGDVDYARYAPVHVADMMRETLELRYGETPHWRMGFASVITREASDVEGNALWVNALVSRIRAAKRAMILSAISE